MIRNWLNRNYRLAKKEVNSHPLVYITLTFILLVAFFVRSYRADQLIGFYFDQGRDALVIWKLWHEGKFFLVGPVTGLEGIFLGPFFYYLISPFYLLGGGHPVAPAVFLAFLSTAALFILYLLGWKMYSRATGIIAATIGAVSYYLVLAGRWLSNPTPILFTSVLLIYALWKIAVHNSRGWWMVVALLTGLSLQLEAASGVFYIPIVLVFAIWRRKHLPTKKQLIIASGLFFATLLPQLLFNFRHENLLFNNFLRLFFEERSFKVDFWTVFDTRTRYFWDVFRTKLFPSSIKFAQVFTIVSALVLTFKYEELKRTKALPLLAIFLIVPMLGYLAFQGNKGNIYDYYMTGYYLPMILLFSLGLGILWKDTLGKISVLIFFMFFLMDNAPLVKNYIVAGVDGPTHITLGNQLKAVQWVYDDASQFGEFNLSVYVPPVIPYAYDYLFLWEGNARCGNDLCGLTSKHRRIVYTFYEQDPPHPQRLDAWLANFTHWTRIDKEERFGGITVQRRISTEFDE